MPIYRTLIFLIGVAFISAGSHAKTRTILEDFEDYLRDIAGSDARDCGTATHEEQKQLANACIVHAFKNGTDAYMLSSEQGEILRATGKIVRGGRVFFYGIDKGAVGNDNSELGPVRSMECKQPSLTGLKNNSILFHCVTPIQSLVTGKVWLMSAYSVGLKSAVKINSEPSYSLRFWDDKNFDGFDGCHYFEGVWWHKGHILALRDVSSTVVADCISPADDAQPTLREFVGRALVKGTYQDVDGYHLVLGAEDGTLFYFIEGADTRLNID